MGPLNKKGLFRAECIILYPARKGCWTALSDCYLRTLCIKTKAWLNRSWHSSCWHILSDGSRRVHPAYLQAGRVFSMTINTTNIPSPCVCLMVKHQTLPTHTHTHTHTRTQTHLVTALCRADGDRSSEMFIEGYSPHSVKVHQCWHSFILL